MNLDQLISARQLAEKAVSDLEDREMQLRAFEVILSALLRPAVVVQQESSSETPQSVDSQPPTNSLAGRVMRLAAEGFFFQQRSLSEVQAKLAEYGWHYPQTSLSTPLMRMVQQRKLRRTQVADGAKHLWKYSNP